MLFMSGPVSDKCKFILQSTYLHSRNLGCYAFVYKLIVLLLERATGERNSWHSAVAGGIGGYFVFGYANDGISQQVKMIVPKEDSAMDYDYVDHSVPGIEEYLCAIAPKLSENSGHAVA